MWSSLQTREFTGGREGVVADSAVDIVWGQRVISGPRRKSASLRRKTAPDFGVDVYRKFAGDLVLGKSTVKGGIAPIGDGESTDIIS